MSDTGHQRSNGYGVTSIFWRKRAFSSKPANISGSSPQKLLCRYGMGCTHIGDPVHRDRFWHPPIPSGALPFTAEDSLRRGKTHTADLYPCYECGLSFRSLENLQLHLKRKTAWSNKSLVGCRISCLIDNREWQEGYVIEYSALTGKHRVGLENEVRWMTMLKTAFFILRRPQPPPPSAEQSETKEVEMDSKGLDVNLAPVETWTYEEEISIDYARSQALMHKAYGWKIQETGHRTQGHLCVTEEDKVLAKDAKSSLLYGELLPRGINKAMVRSRLNGPEAAVIYELGMGIGKVALQLFLQFQRVQRVYAVELSVARFTIAVEALRNLCIENPRDFAITLEQPQRIIVTNLRSCGILEMEIRNLLDVEGIETADIVLLETDLSSNVYTDLCGLLRHMKRGSRAFTYLDLRKIWLAAGPFPYRQLDINRPISDRYATSWSVNRGHHFFLWGKVLPNFQEEAHHPSSSNRSRIDSLSDHFPFDCPFGGQPDVVILPDGQLDHYGYPLHVHSPSHSPMRPHPSPVPCTITSTARKRVQGLQRSHAQGACSPSSLTQEGCTSIFPTQDRGNMSPLPLLSSIRRSFRRFWRGRECYPGKDRPPSPSPIQALKTSALTSIPLPPSHAGLSRHVIGMKDLPAYEAAISSSGNSPVSISATSSAIVTLHAQTV